MDGDAEIRFSPKRLKLPRANSMRRWETLTLTWKLALDGVIGLNRVCNRLLTFQVFPLLV